MEDLSLVVGLMNLRIYDILKKSEIDDFTGDVCQSILDLEKALASYINSGKEAEKSSAKERIKDVGEALNNSGGFPLMSACCELISLKNKEYESCLNWIWSGIGDWLA